MTEKLNMLSKDKERIYSLLSIIVFAYCCLIGNSKDMLLSAIGIGGLLIFINEPQYLIAPIFLFTLLDDYIIAFEGMSFGRICILIFIPFMFFKMIKNKSLVYNMDTTILTLVYALFVTILSINPRNDYVSVPFSLLLSLLLFFILANSRVDDRKGILRQLTLLSVFTVLFIAFKMFIEQESTYSRVTIDAGVGVNALGMSLAQISVILFVGIFSNIKISKLILIPSFLLSVICTVFTGSRSALFAILIGCLVVWLIMLPKIKLKGYFLNSTIVLLSIIAISLYLLFIMPDQLPSVINRFSIDSLISSHGSNRFDIWKVIIEDIMPGKWLFGIGFDTSNVYYAVEEFRGKGSGAHNILMEILTKTGFIGFIFITGIFILSIRKIIKRDRKFEYIIIPLAIVMTIILNGIGEDILTTRILWYGLGLGIMLTNSDDNILMRGYSND